MVPVSHGKTRAYVKSKVGGLTKVVQEIRAYERMRQQRAKAHAERRGFGGPPQTDVHVSDNVGHEEL